ncbi:staphylopine family metallophore export MFS transporter CntE [Paenibacillus sp. GCM10012307]|uniref:MFS transporter n=2 Tax=Paenibacillus roseus TaxID=2798579 RepID=A0A934J470_9BACL|nr:MFS transporter [Paenibacillus roseus]MBJ6360095.1 MFS transporter [Paenibacillus roseus]
MTWPFLRLYGLAFLFFSANPILNVILPLRGESLGANNAQIGLVMGSYMLTSMVLRPWAGYFTQKYGPLNILRILLVANGLALILYTISGLEGFVAARLIQGVSTAFVSMALQMGIIDALPDHERSQGVSLLTLSTYIPSIIGPLLALGIWEWGGMNAFTMAMVGIAVITAVFGFNAPIQSSPKAEGGAVKSSPGMFKAFGQLVTNRSLMISSILMFAASVVFGAVTMFLPLYATQINNGNAGIYLMIQAAVVVLSRFLLRNRIPSDGKWHPRLVIGILLIAAGAAELLSLSKLAGAGLLYASAVLMGTAQALLYPILMTYLTFVLPAVSRNVRIGLFIAMADFGMSMGGIVMGLVADVWSYSAMYAFCSGLLIAAGLVAFFSRNAKEM